MNYCPHCGKPLRGGKFSFCEGCTEKPFIEDNSGKLSESKKGKGPQKHNKKTKIHTMKRENLTPQDRPDDGYDGYYDDIRPEDENEVRQGIDKDIMKRIAGIIASVMIIICCCIGIMYLI